MSVTFSRLTTKSILIKQFFEQRRGLFSIAITVIYACELQKERKANLNVLLTLSSTIAMLLTCFISFKVLKLMDLNGSNIIFPINRS